MKNLFLLFAASMMLLSCSGGLEVKEIEFHPDSDITDASAIKVVNISAPSLLKTGALSGKITCSAEIEVVNDLGEVDDANCKLALLDKNGADIIILYPAMSRKGSGLAELFKTSGKKTIVFESEGGLSPSNIERWIDQTEAVQIQQMVLDTKKKVQKQEQEMDDSELTDLIAKASTFVSATNFAASSGSVTKRFLSIVPSAP